MKKAQFFIDDVLWLFRDLTRKKPASLFDNEFMSVLKKAYDEYGVKVQLNAFYRTSFWYGDDEFSLSDMTDMYKKEWEENSHWLKIGFHSKEEWPDYPYINADYSLVDANFKLIKGEIVRFAGEGSFAKSVVPHWAPISREGIQALYDNGIRICYATYGEKVEFGDNANLPYGHEFRLLHNRKKETCVYNKVTRDNAVARALCGYNHIGEDDYMSCLGKFKAFRDEGTGMGYTTAAQAVLNLIPLDIMEEEFSKFTEQEYLSIGNHEQYFYPNYALYQADFEEKLDAVFACLTGNGFKSVFFEERI